MHLPFDDIHRMLAVMSITFFFLGWGWCEAWFIWNKEIQHSKCYTWTESDQQNVPRPNRSDVGPDRSRPMIWTCTITNQYRYYVYQSTVAFYRNQLHWLPIRQRITRCVCVCWSTNAYIRQHQATLLRCVHQRVYVQFLLCSAWRPCRTSRQNGQCKFHWMWSDPVELIGTGCAWPSLRLTQFCVLLKTVPFC